jgi:cyclophilin family peptidyl-prolyl cis-trans isomerase
MVGMALAGKDTGGSQLFITFAPQPHLDGGYTIFASVQEGLDVAEQLLPGDGIISTTLLED